MVLTQEERTAQRKLIGTLNMRNAMWFEPDVGFCIWRDQRDSQAWGAGIPELSAHFDTLAIPYVVRPEVQAVGKRQKAGLTLVVRWEELPSLTRWAPSFQKQIDNAHAEMDAAASGS
ncbi:hypothetical protein [Curtobacterium sp. MMLR14_010]|uniref:hypothetical protein n=1 Tax=Curtobacterium sp. MMLR14_010 TaxID=1898743 RepID=UPI001113A503|nr:hypothetical protein [Curtobacterium sp. MMLR14_010]